MLRLVRLTSSGDRISWTVPGSSTVMTINSAQAPKEYRFPLHLPLEATAELTTDGAIVVTSADGKQIGQFAPPWAADANGAPVATRYRLDGNVVVQTVDFAGHTPFPVVADPCGSKIRINILDFFCHGSRKIEKVQQAIKRVAAPLAKKCLKGAALGALGGRALKGFDVKREDGKLFGRVAGGGWILLGGGVVGCLQGVFN